MKIFKRFLVLIVLLLSFSTTFGAYSDISQSSITAYEVFYKEINSQAKNVDSKITLLKQINSILESYNDRRDFSTEKLKLFGDFQKLNNEKIFELEYNKNIEINKSSFTNETILSYYQVFSYDKNRLFLENGIWYFYDYDYYSSFEDEDYINEANLKYNNILDKNVLVYKENGIYYFIKDYKKTKVISDNIIYGFPNKYDLLYQLKKNKSLGLYSDDDATLLQIEKKSLEITQGLKNIDDKIAAIYSFVLNNLEYSLVSVHDYDDPKNHSGIEAYKTRKAVCEGYTELFFLMLGFNNIASTIIIGDVFDVEEFPEVAHTWVKIGNYYYDPTYDDPIGQTGTLSKSEYSFYKIPEDLFYINRYDYSNTPEYLKTRTLEYRKNISLQNLVKLYPKYKNTDYKALIPLKFKEANGLALNTKITINDLKNIMTYYELKDGILSGTGYSKQVQSFEYYTIDDNVVEDFLAINSYDLKNLLLIKWTKDNGNVEYITTTIDKIVYLN